jgi:predicted TIM-barrel fold metal-dependent hydrolase
MKIIAGRPAWPWQEEMIAVMLHKPNVWAELHGWSPKYLTDTLKHEISRRFKHRIMFGADYPLFRYERLVQDWHSLGYDQETWITCSTGTPKRFLRSAPRFAASPPRRAVGAMS